MALRIANAMKINKLWMNRKTSKTSLPMNKLKYSTI